MKEILSQTSHKVKIQDKFWRNYMDVVRDAVIPYQWEVLNDRVPDVAPSHAIENFRIAAGELSGEFHGMVFQDSDVAKWLEAVAYSLENDPNPELEETADAFIDLLGKAQQEDGYLNTYFTLKEPDKRWSNLRDKHELYCAGHMMEAAVAYYQSTGKKKLLNIMCRFADYIDSVFGEADDKIPGYPGHQEIELALIKLYRVTGNERYLKLSQYFINQRGQAPHYFDTEAEKRGDTNDFWFNNDYGYMQAHLPVREQTEAVGHSVRAMYMYTALADLVAHTGDEALKEVCQTLWDNVTLRQMYITGGVGPAEFGEAFSFDYDLPNGTCYTETCASIGLVFWANRMLKTDPDGQYADVMERALYNGTISGMDLNGKRFFYVNPLEVHPETAEKRHDYRHVKPVRQNWYSCACCPPNLARLIASIGHYIYSVDQNTIYTHLYIGNESKLEVDGQKVQIEQETNYPWDEDVKVTVSPEREAEFTVAVRIPGWCKEAEIKVDGDPVDLHSCLKNGYVYVSRLWKKGDQIELHFSMPVERMRANPKVRENAGKVALQRGPIVYCLEEVDNGTGLSSISLPPDSELRAEFEPDLLNGVVTLTGNAERADDSSWNGQLYKSGEYQSVPVAIKAVPYYAWCNRTPGEMAVWIQEKN